MDFENEYDNTVSITRFLKRIHFMKINLKDCKIP